MSDLLRSLPIHNDNLERFRNANGVATKLSNIAAGDPSYHGKGLTRGNKIEKEIWAEIQMPGGKQKLLEYATAIRESSKSGSSALNVPEEGEEEVMKERFFIENIELVNEILKLSERKRLQSLALQAS